MKDVFLAPFGAALFLFIGLVTFFVPVGFAFGIPVGVTAASSGLASAFFFIFAIINNIKP